MIYEGNELLGHERVSICGPTGLFCLSYFTLLAVQVVFHQRTILHKLEQ